jgi:hypothetical protein
MNLAPCQDMLPIEGARRHKENRECRKDAFEAAETLRPWFFVRGSAVIDRRYRGTAFNAFNSFPWIPSNPPLLKIATTSSGFSRGTSFSII